MDLVDGTSPLGLDERTISLAPEETPGEQELGRALRGSPGCLVSCSAIPVGQAPKREEGLLHGGCVRARVLVTVPSTVRPLKGD